MSIWIHIVLLCVLCIPLRFQTHDGPKRNRQTGCGHIVKCMRDLGENGGCRLLNGKSSHCTNNNLLLLVVRSGVPAKVRGKPCFIPRCVKISHNHPLENFVVAQA